MELCILIFLHTDGLVQDCINISHHIDDLVEVFHWAIDILLGITTLKSTENSRIWSWEIPGNII